MKLEHWPRLVGDGLALATHRHRELTVALRHLCRAWAPKQELTSVQVCQRFSYESSKKSYYSLGKSDNFPIFPDSYRFFGLSWETSTFNNYHPEDSRYSIVHTIVLWHAPTAGAFAE